MKDDGVAFTVGCALGMLLFALLAVIVVAPIARLRGAREALGAPTSAQIMEIDGVDYLVWTDGGTVRSHKMEAGR